MTWQPDRPDGATSDTERLFTAITALQADARQRGLTETAVTF